METLYHATYGRLVPSILERGLIPRFHEFWEDCERGVYLASDQYEAESYAEVAEHPDIQEEDYDDIVIFEIDTTLLDQSKLGPDPHVRWNENPSGFSTWIYRGEIPVAALKNADRIKSGCKF